VVPCVGAGNRKGPSADCSEAVLSDVWRKLSAMEPLGTSVVFHFRTQLCTMCAVGSVICTVVKQKYAIGHLHKPHCQVRSQNAVKSKFSEALPQTPLGEFTALPSAPQTP